MNYFIPLDADDVALDQDIAEAVTQERVVGIFRAQFDMGFAQEKPFDGGLFVVDECDHDFSVPGVLARFANCQIAVQDSGILH